MEKLINIIGIILCRIGIHRFICSVYDCIKEFGYVPNDGRMPKNSRCERCNIKYGK